MKTISQFSWKTKDAENVKEFEKWINSHVLFGLAQSSCSKTRQSDKKNGKISSFGVNDEQNDMRIHERAKDNC